MVADDTPPSAPRELTIAPPIGSRATLVGTTRYGKTTLACSFLGMIRKPTTRVVAIDTKGDGALNRLARAHGYFDSIVPVVPSSKHPKVLLHLPPDPELMQPLFHRLVADGDVLIYIDELTHCSEPGARQQGLRSVYSTGGGRGVGIWACTQQPYFLPSFVLSQSDRLFVFRLKRDDDRKRMSGYIGAGALRSQHFERGRFLYHDDDLVEAIECDPIPLPPTH